MQTNGGKARETQAKEKLAALDGFRFLSASLIFYGHFAWIQLRHIKNQGLDTLSGRGNVGVNVFFLLTGFVLWIAYGNKPHIETAQGHKSFFVARLARVYPSYLIALLLTIPLAMRDIDWYPDPWRWLFLLLDPLMLQAWFWPILYTWNMAAWTVSTFVAFWAVFPLLPRFLRPITDGLTLLGLWMLSYALSMAPFVVALIWFNGGSGHIPTAVGVKNAAYTIPRAFPPLCLPKFCMGMIAAHYFVSSDTRKWRWWGVLGDLSLLATAMICCFVPQSPNWNYPDDREGYDLLFECMLSPLLITIIMALSANQGLAAKVFSCRPIAALGQASFTIYIFQDAISPILTDYWLNHYGPAADTIVFYVLFVLVVGCGMLVHRYYEEPAQRKIVAWYAALQTAEQTKETDAASNSPTAKVVLFSHSSASYGLESTPVPVSATDKEVLISTSAPASDAITPA